MAHNTRVNLSSLVSRQLPEFVREDYPTFVAFVEAYYEYMHSQEVDLTKIRDIDTTLDEFIKYFKKELAVNLPIVVEDERLLLTHIKDQYLAKGSEGSFKLLFRMMFGKSVELKYPGNSMLIASDGRWNQEISIFVRVEYGDPNITVGKLIDIVSGDRILRVLVDRKETLVGEVDRIVAIGNNVFELFLDKKFFGNINAGDRIKYKDEFQAQILPATTKISISQPGKNFRVGQVFELLSGGGTGGLLKVTSTISGGGIKTAEIIKFGVGYSADFAISILANNTVTARQVAVSSSSSRVGDTLYIGDLTEGTEEQGWISAGDYLSSSYISGTYAGTVLRTFTLSSKNANIDATEPAIINVQLGALNRYPGYFETNNGFPSDSIYIQDSLYYQRFSYVLKIDERLDSYKSAVKTMIHPAGMRMFGEYDISNNFDLSVALESLVKSLGIGLEDDIPDVNDSAPLLYVTKYNQDFTSVGLTDFWKVISKSLETTSVGTLNDSYTQKFSKRVDDSQTVADSGTVVSFNKTLAEYSVGTLSDSITAVELSKSLSDSQSFTETTDLITYKYVTDTSVGTFNETGQVWINPYQAQDYYSEEYSVGLQQSF